MQFIFVLLLGLFLCGIHCKTKNNKRIIGGQNAPFDKYRWAVSIKGDIDEVKSVGACGASILKTEGDISWLVTAAHCFFPQGKRKTYNLTNPKQWHARVGITEVDFYYKKHGSSYIFRQELKATYGKSYKDLFKDEESTIPTGDSHIEKIFIHPDYIRSRLENDIALMKLTEPLPVTLRRVSAIDFPHLSANEKWPEVDSRCLMVGWGCTKAEGAPNTEAKLAFLKIWNNKKCEEAFVKPIDLNPAHEFCAGHVKMNYGLCQGDSGSGLACRYKGKWTLAGVVSAVHSKLPGDYPAIFTRVSWFKNWIFDIIKKN